MEQNITGIKQKKTLNKRQKDMIFVACLVILPLIHYLIFYVYVNFNSILLAFQKLDPETYKYTWCGLENFIGTGKTITVGDKTYTDLGLFGEFREVYKGTPMLLLTIKNSLIYYLIHTGVGTTLTLFFSYYIFKN